MQYYLINPNSPKIKRTFNKISLMLDKSRVAESDWPDPGLTIKKIRVRIRLSRNSGSELRITNYIFGKLLLYFGFCQLIERKLLQTLK